MEAHKPIEACFLIQHPDSLVSDSLARGVKQKLLLMIEYNLICKYAAFITSKDLSLTNKQSYTSRSDSWLIFSFQRWRMHFIQLSGLCNLYVIFIEKENIIHLETFTFLSNSYLMPNNWIGKWREPNKIKLSLFSIYWYFSIFFQKALRLNEGDWVISEGPTLVVMICFSLKEVRRL